MTDRIALLLGQWFFTGRSPKAPGTVGSFGAIPLFLLLRQLPGGGYWLATLAVLFVGLWASQKCSEILGEKDPPSVVIDEVAGQYVALSVIPLQA